MRVFPKWEKEADEHLWVNKARIWTTASLCPYIRYPSNLGCRMPDKPVGSADVIILDHLNSQGLQWAAQGATLLVLSSGDGSLDPLETLPEQYHPVWWEGNPITSSMGTVVYPGFDAIAPGMAPQVRCKLLVLVVSCVRVSDIAVKLDRDGVMLAGRKWSVGQPP